MPQLVTGPDGSTISFPDGTDDATINQVMHQAYGSQGQAAPAGQANAGQAPNPNGQGNQPPSAPYQDPVTGFITSALKPYDNAARMIDQYVPGMKSVDQFLAGATGTPNEPIGTTIGGGRPVGPVTSFAGNVAGTAPLAFVTKDPWIGGALGGAALTNQPTDPGAVLTDAITGAVGGKATQFGLDRLAGVVNPFVRPALQRLLSAGMDAFTPGQLLGGTAQLLENSARSAPFLGDAVHAGQNATLTDFNNAAYNSALKDIQMQLPKGVTGHDAATFTQQAISQKYNQILPTLRIQADTTFATDMQDLRQEVMDGGLPAEKRQQFFDFMKGIGNRFSKSGGMTGRTMGDVDTLLGQEYAQYRGSPNPDDQKYAKYLLMAQASLRNMVYRANPGRRAELEGMRSAFSKFVPAELAAGSPATDATGRFQPIGLKQAAAQNSTVRQMAQGRAQQQGLAESGQAVIGNVMPNANRLLFNALGGVGAVAAHLSPTLALPLGAASLMYTPAGRRMITRLMTGRQGPVAATLGAGIRATARSGLPGVVGAAAAPKKRVYAPPSPSEDNVDLGVTGR